MPDELVNHFKECCDKFLKCEFFDETFEIANLKNQIWTE